MNFELFFLLPVRDIFNLFTLTQHDRKRKLTKLDGNSIFN